MNSMAVGVDIAKLVFQVHYVDQETGEIVNRPIKRAKFLEHFANRTRCLIGMEACGGAHHWFAAKPATVKLKVRALKKLKDAAQ